MAGGKESPRQKMIGMMYLVLTALLALQVSSAIIQKFQFLDDSLQNAKNSADKTNHETQLKIQKAVGDAGNKANDVAVLNRAQEVRKETQAILKQLNDLRDELIKATGGMDDDGRSYKGAKNEDEVAIIMVGPEGKKNGKGYKLKDDLNGFSKKLSSLIGENVLPYRAIALDGKDDPTFNKDPEQKGKDFVELNFSQTPMVAALAVLSTKQADVLKLESMALEHLATQVGASDLKFDQVVAMVRPASKVVAAGTDYEAEMFLAASSSAITPTMTYNGRSINVDGGTKIGKIKFKAAASGYDKEGMSKQTWKGTINFKFKGKDTAFQVVEDFYVAKPVMQIQSASVSALYKNCGNELNVQVPALGSTYNPAFNATGAQVIKGAQKGLVTLVPTGAKVVLSVSSNGAAIGNQEFNVRLIPKPTIEALNNGKPVDEKAGVPAPGPRSITMKAIPDESFKTFLPKDARYRVALWDCILVRGKRPVAQQMAITSETANLANFSASAQPGDRILIEVKKVQRKNFLEQTEDVNLGTIIKNIPLH